ncbi:ParA family protein [Microbacterium sp. HSID17254]|nr:ParA family protein [Microbacterium sp. HSID17254]
MHECGCAIVRLVRYAIANNKGGAGKTTVALCLADALAARGRRVLMVDMDPQANLTRRLGYAESDLSSMVTTSEVVRENRTGCAAEAVIGCRWLVPWAERIDLVPSRFDLENRVPEAGQLGTHLRLARGLDGVTDDYDVVFLDCPPSLGHLTQLSFAAADGVIAPVVAEYDHVAGATRVRDFLTASAQHLDRPGLALVGVIVNAQDRRRGLHTWHLGSLRDLFGDLVWTPPVPSRSVLAEAMDAAAPLRAQTGSVARDLVTIFDELADRLVSTNAAA